ncbi:ATPase [Streptomyces sp. PLAI1-29]|uniref:ATPase n=2 Tax=Streptomyces zingiberis TaxID=2053010 RepID=A0ABX1C2S4_9ACTN|nr:ATPase [Streptomyces zingiberis]
MATLGGDLRDRLPEALATELGVRRLALAADAVTAYVGALGQRAGAVVAAGTGMIALGADPGPAPDAVPGRAAGPGADGGPTAPSPAPPAPPMDTAPAPPARPGALTPGPPPADAPDSPRAAGTGGGWRRADGWGHLLGDCGGGAWIGRAGLESALRAYDGRRGGSRALLARLEAVFGPPPGLPGLLYPRPDRAAVLASFAPEVAACADGDPVAAGILRTAARHIAEAAAAVCPPVTGCPVAFTGGLFALGDPLLVPARAELAALVPSARPVPAEGGPLDGALRLAGALATDTLRLPADERMLTLHTGL